MDINIREENSKYIMNISYDVESDRQTVFELIATDSGFKTWFPELKIEEINGEKWLVFEMEDFREEMRILSYNKNENISYEWDSAIVKFNLSQSNNCTKVHFEEIIPKDFGNEFSNAEKDMTGWLVQNNCIMELLNNNILPKNIDELREKWGNFVRVNIG